MLATSVCLFIYNSNRCASFYFFVAPPRFAAPLRIQLFYTALQFSSLLSYPFFLFIFSICLIYTMVPHELRASLVIFCPFSLSAAYLLIYSRFSLSSCNSLPISRIYVACKSFIDTSFRFLTCPLSTFRYIHCFPFPYKEFYIWSLAHILHRVLLCL